MYNRFEDHNYYFDDCCYEKRKKYHNCCYPSYIDNQVIVRGPIGPTRSVGATGAGGILNFADFYALMPPDNSATVALGTDVSFPQDGPNSGSDIVRTRPVSAHLVITQIQ